jgi:hypothetical protein
MIVKKYVRGILGLLPALLCLSTPVAAELPETGVPASAGVATTPKVSSAHPSSVVNAKPASAASSARSDQSKDDAAPVTRSLFPNSPHPSVDPTQPWPRSGAADEAK